MRYLSVCAGIEAATVAWHHMGWEPAGFSEIEKFPSLVLDHHYPQVPKLGDMTKYKEWNLGTIDLLVGGTPCQSFSVAGLRKGLADPRGNLALVYLGIADAYKPKWIVWENVPGVLSSNGGRDFGSFLGALAQLGYGFAYRVLDAQYFGVAQRRRRVFVVGYFGDWRPAAAVLFESKGLSRDTKPSREKGEDPSGRSTVGTITRSWSKGLGHNSQDEMAIMQPVVGSLTAKGPCAMGAPEVDGGHYLPMQGNLIGREAGGPQGVGASDEGVMCTLTKADVHGVSYGIRTANTSSNGWGIQQEITHTLDTAQGVAVAQPIPIDSMNHLGRKDSHSFGDFVEGAPSFTLTKGHHHAVAQPVAPTLTASNDPSRSPQSSGVTNQVAAVDAVSMVVRRLTPVECERLQGFPDGYTDIKPKGRDTPDGPRYKALGNSMAVPVMRWIGERINQKEKNS